MKSVALKRFHSLLDKQVRLWDQMTVLVDLLNLCEQAYYKGTPAISDSEYDNYFNTLQSIEAQLPVNWEKVKIVRAIVKGVSNE